MLKMASVRPSYERIIFGLRAVDAVDIVPHSLESHIEDEKIRFARQKLENVGNCILVFRVSQPFRLFRRRGGL